MERSPVMCPSPEKTAGSKGRSPAGAPRDPCRRGTCARGRWLLLAAGFLIIAGESSAGHQVGHYPSYYPDEIRIDAIDPAAAGKALGEETLHAYIGAAPGFTGPLPEHVKPVSSLGWFIVLSVDSASARFASPEGRCAAARGVLAQLRGETAGGFVFHPYPVTPYHADYLHHLDRVEAAIDGLGRAAPAAVAKVRAEGELAQTIVRRRWGAPADAADITLAAVPIEDLLADAGAKVNGWRWPPWIREGWFHAYRLLATGLDAQKLEEAHLAYAPLIRGQARSFAEHADLERNLVAALTASCQRLVAGYVPRTEYYNDRYPEGVENIGYDWLSGLNASIFIRTVKLKDYPWNGKLHLGVSDAAQAAWNPVAGFTDALGRLIWSAVGDPALIPVPSNASWMPNRVQSEVMRVVGQSGGLKVPRDAICPRPGSGAFERVGDRAYASAKVVYEIVASPFEDGSEMAVADLLYPYAFAYRWGSGTDRGGGGERSLAPMLASLEERLVGLKYVRTDKTTHAIAEGLNLDVFTPVLEVYLRDTPGDERQVAALAPPWSTLPWHLLVLMEEAVSKGYAAFSREEATRLGVPWLDLVRDGLLRAKLQDLIATFEREGFRPEPLRSLVGVDQAQARWRALAAFVEKNGHLLVTNGPYRLKRWTPKSVVLEAVRDLTYPLGFGTFDRFVNPPRAAIDSLSQDAGVVTLRASAEMVLKAGRRYQLAREPLLRTTSRGVYGMLVVSRYLLIGPDGKVLSVDKLHWGEDGRFDFKLPDNLPAGEYTVILGIFLDGNAVQPSAKIVRFRVGAERVPG